MQGDSLLHYSNERQWLMGLNDLQGTPLENEADRFLYLQFQALKTSWTSWTCFYAKWPITRSCNSITKIAAYIMSYNRNKVFLDRGALSPFASTFFVWFVWYLKAFETHKSWLRISSYRFLAILPYNGFLCTTHSIRAWVTCDTPCIYWKWRTSWKDFGGRLNKNLWSLSH